MTIWPSLADAMNNAAQVAKAPLRWDPTDHLLARVGFGATPDSRAFVAANGPDAWFAQQVTLGQTKRGYKGVPAVFARSKRCRMTPYDLRQYFIAQGNEYSWQAMDELTQVTLMLQIYSPAQLYEAVVDVLANHLNVPNHIGDLWTVRADYDNNVIRRHAFGSFSDMLVASCKHPAMLRYLSLCDSTKNTVNENYAREMLELHTVGMQYTETDVQNAARMLTGRTTGSRDNYDYDPNIHYKGAIRVLGWTDPNNVPNRSEAVGDAMLRYLAAHPFTAQTIARKLCVRFVSDSPSAELVAAVAQAYVDNGTQILPTVKAILCSTEFWESRGQKLRRPSENLVAAVRVLGNGVVRWKDAMQTLHWMCYALGDIPLEWPAPNGYPDVAAAWHQSGSLLQVWDYHLCFGGQWADGFSPGDLNALYPAPPVTVGDAIDMLTNTLTGTTFADQDRQALLTFLGDTSFSTAVSLSGLRWYLLYLVGLILHSPYHALR